MIGFFIKKAFYDGWDNLFQILLLNVMIVGIAFGGWFLAGLTVAVVPLSILIAVCTILLEGVLLLGISAMMAKVSSFSSFSFSDLFAAMKETWKHGMLFAGLVTLSCAIFAVTLPYYLGLGNTFGFALAVLMFWVAVIFVLSLQWFLPIRSQLDKNFIKCIKKSFIIFFDNPGFSLFMLLYSTVLMVISLVCVMLLPGFSGLILAHNEAFRLRMYKYDWLEKNTEVDIKIARKSIPWMDLIQEDEDTVGHRSLKSFIFPWKD